MIFIEIINYLIQKKSSLSCRKLKDYHLGEIEYFSPGSQQNILYM